MSKLKYLIPNSFTCASLVLGLASLTLAAAGEFRLAGWMILWGVLLDKLDGTAARLLRASSELGAQLDSFADFVVFGIGPAGLFFFRVRAAGGYQGASMALLTGACALYVIATAIRLARFNITTPPHGDRLFYGVPGTLMGAILASTYLTWHEHALNEDLLLYSPALLVVGAALMVSTLRIPKLTSRKSRAVNVFQIVNVAAVYVLAPLMLLPEYMMALAVTYTVGGLAWGWLVPLDTPPDDSPERELAT